MKKSLDEIRNLITEYNYIYIINKYKIETCDILYVTADISTIKILEHLYDLYDIDSSDITEFLTY